MSNHSHHEKRNDSRSYMWIRCWLPGQNYRLYRETEGSGCPLDISAVLLYISKLLYVDLDQIHRKPAILFQTTIAVLEDEEFPKFFTPFCSCSTTTGVFGQLEF